MKRVGLVVVAGLILISLSTARAQQPTLFIYSWSSLYPVQIEKIQVVGGSILSAQSDQSNLSGSVWVVVERVCTSLRIEGKTSFGAGVSMGQTWDGGCDRLYLPITIGGIDELGR